MEPRTVQTGQGLPATIAANPSPLPGNGACSPELQLADDLVGKLVTEMTQAWRGGRALLTEELLARHPALRDQKDVVLRLICEELCLRREAKAPADRADFVQRLPQWQHEIEALFECQKILDDEGGGSTATSPFKTFRDLHILEELGQGGQGCVFLATQPLLADRPVVLKVTPCHGGEHLSLARLQHTNIVPLYWAQDHPEEDQRLLCMPYFGSTTLTHLLKALEPIPLEQRTGQHILDVLDKGQSPHVPRLPVRGPARLLLGRASYAQAIAWMSACLADALHYAHERDLVHLDIKPSNMLLTTEGQPMLLDFHLARHPLRAGEQQAGGIGGTPLYMAPEQDLALHAVLNNQPVPQAVDGRADIYSLGLMMYQALGGPFPYRWKNPEPLEECNPQVSPGLADIVRRCLERDPSRRYASAEELAADLRRHLSHLPLRGVPNRSLQERWHKWRRRKPQALVFCFLLMVMTVLTGAAGWLLWSGHQTRQQQQQGARQETQERLERARKALVQGQEQIKDRKYDLALVTLEQARPWLPDSPEGQQLAQAFAEQHQRAGQKKAAQLLHAAVDLLRSAAVADSLTRSQRQELQNKCALLWEQRSLFLPLTLREALTRHDVTDLAVIWSDLRENLTSVAERPTVQRAICDVLMEVDQFCGPSRLLTQAFLPRARSLGLQDQAGSWQERLQKAGVASAWEQVALGRDLMKEKNCQDQALLATRLTAAAAPSSPWPMVGFATLTGDQGQLQLARHYFQQALAQEPANYWAHYYLGVCSYRLRLTTEAIRAFTVCLALAPEEAVTFYNRALALSQAGEWQQALEDYNQALKRDPRFAPAVLNRALLHVRLQDYPAAVADLHLARAAGADPNLVQANLQAVQKMQGKLKGKTRR